MAARQALNLCEAELLVLPWDGADIPQSSAGVSRGQSRISVVTTTAALRAAGAPPHIAAALRSDSPDHRTGGRTMAAAGGHGWFSRKERIARAALGMAAGHPELVTCKPGRAEWKLLVTWCAELWPNDEYTSIVAEEWRQDRPPGTEGWR